MITKIERKNICKDSSTAQFNVIQLLASATACMKFFLASIDVKRRLLTKRANETQKVCSPSYKIFWQTRGALETLKVALRDLRNR